jgi:ATP-binding cassette subfamily F protein uup
MPLLTLQDAELAYGDLPLLDRASFSLEAGERIGLIGRNGTGKSSLLGVIAGRTALDDGELRRRDGLTVALVEQEPALPERPTLKEALLARAAVPEQHKLEAASASARRWRSPSRSSRSCCCSTSRPTTSTSRQ